MLHSFDWQLVTVVSGQDIDSFFKGQPVLIRPIPKDQAGWNAWPSRMEAIGSLETSVNNYQPTMRNIPEERRTHLHRGSL